VLYDPTIWSLWAEILQQLDELTSPDVAAAGRPWTRRSSICQPWPGWDRDHYDGPWNHRTANPVLVVGNRFDPATPYHGMVTVDRLLRGRGCSPWRLGPAGRP
jgi:TAP-like protein